MSLGGGIGAVIGGIIGFFNPALGIIYGAAIGFGIGMMIDPVTPDAPTAGTPNPEKAVMKSEVGVPCPDLCGTAKIVGHLINYGAERAVEQFQEVEGGKGGGGGTQVSAGFEYYMSWSLGIVKGPIDKLYAIYKNDDAFPIWSGVLSIPTSGGEETLVIEDFGTIVFYFGTNDQVPNANVGAILDDDTLNTPYRNYCWAFMDDCLIGSYPRTPTLSFIVSKFPDKSFNSNNIVETYDSNPMQVMWYALEDMCGLPVSWLDAVDFSDVADTLFEDGVGISMLFADQTSAIGYLQSINMHIDNVLRYGSDGAFHPKLIRDDYDVDTLPLVNEDVMLDDPTFVRKSWIDTINEGKVQYNELINVIRYPAPSSMFEGRLVAPVSKRTTSDIYAYLITDTGGAVVKINTAPLLTPTLPKATDLLVINEDPDYILDYADIDFGSTRGGYAISKNSYNKIWYLFRNESNGNIKLVEVDITLSPMSITKESIHTGILVGGEFIEDGAAVDSNCFFPTSKQSGRILKFNTDHILTDEEFNYSGTGSDDEPIRSITIDPSKNQIAWLYNRNPTTAKVKYTDYIYNIVCSYCSYDGGVDSANWQNFLRYDERYDHIFRQRMYHPNNGVAYYYSKWDQNIGRQYVQYLQYMKQYLGGGASYFYIIHKDNSGGKSYLHRFTVGDSTAGGAVPQIKTEVTSIVRQYEATDSFHSIYSEASAKSCLLRYNPANKLNYIATYNSNLNKISDPVLDTIYWGY